MAQSEFDIRRYIPSHFIILVLCLFLVVPAHLVTENISELSNFDPRAFLGFALIALLVLLLLSLVYFGLEKVSLGKYYSKLVEVSMFAVIITGFFLPASESTGMEDAAVLSVDVPNVLLAVGLVALLTYIASFQRRLLFLIVTAFVAINAAFSIPALYSLATRDDAGNRELFELSSSKNIIVLSFDGVPGPLVRELLQEHPKFRDVLNGFVFYERVVSSSPATSASTVASLYGNSAFEGAKTDKDLWEFAPEDLVTNQMSAGGYNVSTYGVYNRANADPAGRNHTIAERASYGSLTLLNYSIARTITRFFVFRGELRSNIETAFDRMLTSLDKRNFELLARFADSNAPLWKKQPLTPTILDFEAYVSNLRAISAMPVAHFLHFTYPHYPVEFDRHCEFRAQDAKWFSSHQDRQSVKEEAICILQQFSSFLTRLDELRLLDKSLLVLKSDHGKPVEYHDPHRLEGQTIEGHALWGYGRYLPLLAIKDFGPSVSALRFDRHPVMLDDLAKTLCISAGLSFDCQRYAGFDLLGDDFSGIEAATVTMFAVTGPDSDFRFRTHRPITIPRGEHVLESLHDELSGPEVHP